MNILVCISNVPDTTSKINFVENDTKFDTNGVQYIINPNDEFGLTKAVWMKESHSANVTVLTVGDQSTEPTLRKCLAIGADKAIRINGNAKDGCSVAKEIAHFCKNEKFDLIICGRESIDYNGGVVAGVIAGILDYNFITNCVNLDIKGSNAEASREIDGGIETDLTVICLADNHFRIITAAANRERDKFHIKKHISENTKLIDVTDDFCTLGIFGPKSRDLMSDLSKNDLMNFGKIDGYVERQISGWTKRYYHAKTEDIPEMDFIANWLAEKQPKESSSSIIHNDFKYDNMVLDSSNQTKVIAVLDWEMATLGDPLMDFGTTLGYWTDKNDPEELQIFQLSPTTLDGNPSRAELVDMYEKKSGIQIDNPVFYYVYGLFKIAIIAQQIYFRYHKGYTKDKRFSMLNLAVKSLAIMANQAIVKDRVSDLFE